ncbi:MAG: hypothetical protein HGA37_18425, partial [Lentimicrobium sp.]|nr:hypothetical protein [Lentimicrobium sp.]
WYQITRSPVVTSTTKGPGNLLSFGAGISVKFGTGKPQAGIPVNNTSVKVDTRTDVPVPAVEPGAPVAGKQPEVPVSPAIVEKKEEERKPDKDYTRPSILSPANGSNISTSEAKKPVILNWTPVLPPPPAGNVVYQVKLVEVSTNQTADQAIRSNKALLDKSIDAATSTSWSPPQATSGEAKNYAWNVRATDKSGKPYGENNGTSETAAFMMGQNDIDISIDSLSVDCCKDGKQLVKITVKNNLPNANTVLKKIWIMAVNGNFGIPYPVDITGMVSPPLPFSFLPSSASVSQGRLNLTASIDCIKDIKTIVLKAEGERNTNLGLVTDNDLEADTLKCICTDCDNIVIEMPENVVHNYTGNSVSMTTPVLVSPKKVTKVTADVVYFSFTPESEECAPCNKDSKAFGNLVSASLNANGFPVAAAIPYGHEAVWTSNNPGGVNLNGQFSFNITMPPLVKCCSAKVRYCIRYSFQFEDCTVCDKVICYSFNKKGCNQ